MAKIRKIRPTDIKKIREMVEYVQPGTASSFVSEGHFTFFPLDMLHEFLPPHLRFLQECYVAVEDKEILGLIGLIPDGKQKIRWKINRLVLNINAYDIGKQLIDYVVNKYGGAGVETFLTIIDENYPEAISLFKNACSFRSCTQILIWEKDNLEFVKPPQVSPLIREVRSSDAQQLQELDEQSLFPQFRTSLIKNVSGFNFGIKNQILNYFKGYKVKRFVLDNPRKNSIEGYILIVSKDNKDFWADITLSLAYQDYYEDLMNYVINFVKAQNKAARLYTYVRKYYQSSKKLNDVVTDLNFKLSHTFQVLAKDYWKATPVSAEGKKSPIIIFPDITSPARNILQLESQGDK